ncbi:MAG: hypothetical protein EU981_04100 [Candidatus Liberibacter ctenarytainae]|uniref:Uncharacterized protein n=1 Tax=Candidatus Liberibacter ctenarytainae TaxID=2020335 RepID=A0A937DM50_9HYPH|nr:hypothetical protein [Candidatus Liberibacter ctenarytainae]
MEYQWLFDTALFFYIVVRDLIYKRDLRNVWKNFSAELKERRIFLPTRMLKEEDREKLINEEIFAEEEVKKKKESEEENNGL